MKKRRLSLSTTQIIMASFLLVILVGSVLLSLPISSASGEAVGYLDALFMATTSTCVTGLVTLPTVTTWSVFGQIVILLLIQVGGLGIITILAGLMIIFQRRIGMEDRILIQDAFNLNTLSGIVRFIKKVIIGTVVVEGAGALLYMTVFVPEYGARGIWISIFNSISAFCNAGIDILAEDSLCGYALDLRVNLVTSALIILGGLGYIVWWDLLRVMKGFKDQKFKCLKGLTLHSKIALSATVFFILSGMAAFFVLEYSNPLTMEGRSLPEKLLLSFFQSVTTRTAGFATIPQQDLTNASSFVALVLMFIGGSPVGTAGGVKTVTIIVLAAAAISTVRNKNEVTLFNRTISRQTISKAVAVVSMSFFIAFLSTLLLSMVTEASAMDIMYETISATATVGLSRNLTGSINAWGKAIIIMTMYLGRVGPISLAIAFNVRKESQNLIKNPTEDISVG